MADVQQHELFQDGDQTARINVSSDDRADTAIQALGKKLDLARHPGASSWGFNTSIQRRSTGSRFVASKPKERQKCTAVANQQLAEQVYVALRAATSARSERGHERSTLTRIHCRPGGR